MAMFDIPRLPEDEDWDKEARQGFEAFCDGRMAIVMISAAQQRGWWMAWARCFGMGVKASALAGADEIENPYPQFSGPWEAWGDGFNAEERL